VTTVAIVTSSNTNFSQHFAFSNWNAHQP